MTDSPAAYTHVRGARIDRLPCPIRGPRLVDVVLTLIDAHGLNANAVRKRYGVGPTWLRELKANPERSPQCDTMQYIYEDLTGRPLVTLPEDVKQESK